MEIYLLGSRTMFTILLELFYTAWSLPKKKENSLFDTTKVTNSFVGPGKLKIPYLTLLQTSIPNMMAVRPVALWTARIGCQQDGDGGAHCWINYATAGHAKACRLSIWWERKNVVDVHQWIAECSWFIIINSNLVIRCTLCLIKHFSI